MPAFRVAGVLVWNTPGQNVSAGATASGSAGCSGCGNGSKSAGQTAIKPASTTSCLQSKTYLGFPRISADVNASRFTVTYSLGSSDLALSSNLKCSRRRVQIHHRNNFNEKGREYTRGEQRGNVRGYKKKSNSLTSEQSGKKYQTRPTVMMSGRSEKLSFWERMKRNPLMGFFEGASDAFSSNNNPPKNESLEKELGRMVLPALVSEAVGPMAQLTETAIIGTFIDELGMEIAIIALPALLALAADPLASLVDTGFIGQIGPVELAAVGVSISVFNLVSKMFNLPLLNVTTSFVAEEEASAKDAQSSLLEPMTGRSASPDDEVREELLQSMDVYTPRSTKPLLPAVSSALVLGTSLGVVEAVVMALGAGPILTVMGIGVTSPMRVPAVQYLALRAIGAPAVVIALAVQGVFRGFKDTKTPLYATVLGNVVNIVLDPILMFSLKFGVSGAAVATVISQYVIALVLLWILNERVTLLPPRLGDLRFDKFLKSGGLLLGRTVAVIASMTLATSMAARQGPIPMAAHQVCMQVWLAASLLSDSLALAGQAIIASAFAKGDYRLVKEASFRVLQIGLAMGLLMAGLLGAGAGWFTQLFTKDVGVLEAMALIIPFVVVTQPINSLAFVFDGIHYGVSDFGYAAVSMMVIAVPSCIVLLFASPMYALPGVWIGLTVLMTLRMFAGFLRIGSCTGPWKLVLRNSEERLQDLEENPLI
ncbi:unnamed protein product [Calypogeia fissa]